MMLPVHKVQIRWLTAKEGGRQSPFSGSRYAPTARFAAGQEQFSVVLEFAPTAAANPLNATLRLLNPELKDVQNQLVPGAALEILEGARIVARCELRS